MSGYYYVCDRCGNLTSEEAKIPEGTDAPCVKCGSVALWEFTAKHNAVIHSNRIANGVNSGLFRSAR